MVIATLFTAVIVIAICGVIVWLIETQIPMPAAFQTVIRVVVVLALILWLASLLGLWNGRLVW